MPQPKKVAIIGAGPSGLVTAKTLLHDFPDGTFSPIVFEKSHRIGGLWPCEQPTTDHETAPRPRGLVSPSMRTNLSRFSVAFSDLAWETVLGGDTEVPMFPLAWQVGRYLEKYVERYIPEGVVRLGEEVVRTVREVDGSGVEWTVQSEHWTDLIYSGDENGSQEVKSERFDCLVVTSGYFAKPYFPDIPGLADFADKTVHSSTLQTPEDVQQLIDRSGFSGGKLVVVGGSMSGVEAASTLALHLSSLSLSPDSTAQAYEVHHICPRPFWTIPTYLPHSYTQDPSQTHAQEPPFLPLDLVLYDLGRRPPGPIEYGFGPPTAQQITKMNGYFNTLFGPDYASTGSFGIANDNQQPPWIAIGDDYAEYVRSGAINVTIGRVSNINTPSNTLAITLPTPNPPKQETLSNIAAIITATGFTPFSSLTFLPEPILYTLEYSPTDPFLPLILDGKGTSHAEIPDLGFVGFYRGPYWGVMEMQARSLATTWARDITTTTTTTTPIFSEDQLSHKKTERQLVRDFRSTSTATITKNPNPKRTQFPMSDYTGLIESFAREMNIPRAVLPAFHTKHSVSVSDSGSESDSDSSRTGPVIPSRYTLNPIPTTTTEQDTTLSSLQNTIFPSLKHKQDHDLATATAMFRALHGVWRFERRVSFCSFSSDTKIDSEMGKGSGGGVARFVPRYSSEVGYEREYVYMEGDGDADGDRGLVKKRKRKRAVFRLVEDGHSGVGVGDIGVWDDEPGLDSAATERFSHGIRVGVAERQSESGLGKYVIHCHGIGLEDREKRKRYEYTFWVEGVGISSWECGVYESSGGEVTRTVYTRV
ncbi:FAD/NAD(P)-binding domain-containing protein [Aspergillus ellipticus CBS 707.79]|uniref:FAD/NAD(P)-binding domain-containing protein n=1 Tax=Aspergillus ellipticus CBS 707.79 TaxID=1448320 RepID=A0A319DSF1_9EURO|nr:FAD/NAD(P)-binding domain-containing protein [Aspergillus ellipticus CBS 707.79]